MTAPELLSKQMPFVRRIEAILLAYGYTKDSPDYEQAFITEVKMHRMFGSAP